MIAQANSSLQRCIDAIDVPGILIGHRLIAEGDERLLLPEEFGAFAGSVLKVRRASGAARMVARTLLPRLGAPALPIPKLPSGVPVWPSGIVGSLAHDAEVAVAAVALGRDFLGIGVDVEPNEPLDPDLVDMVATPRERQTVGSDAVRGRLLFAIKEAVYKAVNPIDGVFLEHHDVEVSLEKGLAQVRGRRQIHVEYGLADHIVALAYLDEPRK